MTKYRTFKILVLSIVLFVLLGWWMVTQPFILPITSEPPPVEVAQLEKYVRKLSEEFYPRNFDQPEKLEATANYIQSEIDQMGVETTEQIITVQNQEYNNIIVRFGSSEGAVLIVGAHYDSYGDLQEDGKFESGFDLSTHTPGADDNASGVAGLIELARLLSKQPPKRPVELVFFTLEEPPNFRTENMGSAWHARRLREMQRPIKLMICLEMIGFFTDAENSQTYPLPGMSLFYPTQGNFIAVTGRLADWSVTRKSKAILSGATDLPVRSMNAPTWVQGIDFSDHRNYWAEGFPAIMITDSAFYRNLHYHGPGDTYEKLDYSRMAKVVQGVFSLIHELP